MALTVHFNGSALWRPGYYGDPKLYWWQDERRKGLLMLLAKLGVKSANHYSYHL